MFRILLTSAIALMLFFNYFVLNAQGKSDENKPIEFLKSEKFKISPQQIIDALKKAENKEQKSDWVKPGQYKTLDSRESVVSNSGNPESEVMAAINPVDTNNIIISPMHYDLNSQLELLTCPIYYTNDFGQTWTKSSFKNSPNMQDYFVMGGGDPMFVFDAKGNAYFSWIYLMMHVSGFIPDSMCAAMFWAQSFNGGKTWQRQLDDKIAKVSGPIGGGGLLGLDGMHDKQWMAADHSDSPYRNRVYASMTYISVGIQGETDSKLIVFRKLPDKDTFEKDSVLVSKGDYTFVQFSSIDTDSDGNVHVTFFGHHDGINTFYHSMSTDGGETFSPEKPICNFLLDGAAMIPGGDTNRRVTGISTSRSYPCPQMAIDRSGRGNIYFAFSAHGIDEYSNSGIDVYFCKSTDNGSSWSDPKQVHDVIEDDTTSQFYPSISVNENGIVIIGWYDRNKDVNDIYTHYVVGYSFNEGDEFVVVEASSQPTDFSTVGLQNGDFGIGEYNALVSTSHYAIPVWADGRNSNGDLNIYSAFIPLLPGSLISVERIKPINADFKINSPSPNPASENAFCSFELKRNMLVRLEVVDIRGNTILKIAEGRYDTGEHTINANLNGIPNGTYLLRLSTEFGYGAEKIVINR